MGLFLDDSALHELSAALSDTPALFALEDFYTVDRHADGDDYNDGGYRKRFRTLMAACAAQTPVRIEYEGGKSGPSKRKFYPHKLCYSPRDDKFRLLCAAFHARRGRMERMTLNLGRMRVVEILPKEEGREIDWEALQREAVCQEPLVLEISRERNALERCMLQFASFERQTEYDRERDVYICKIAYDPADERELIIRVLSFGPVVRVLGPKPFEAELARRIKRQLALVEESENQT